MALLEIKKGIIGWLRYLLGLDRASAYTIDDRLFTCRQCEYSDRYLGRMYCQMCGCDLAPKTALKSEKCPIEKW